MKAYQFGKHFTNGLPLPIGSIYQVEELSLMRGGVMPAHTQACDEITYVVSGKAKIYSDTHCKEIAPGEIHFIRKGCQHKIEVGQDEDFRYICIGYLMNEAAVPKELYTFFRSQKHFFQPDDASVRRLCVLLVDELYVWDAFSESTVNNYLRQILISVYRIANATLSSSVKNGDDAAKSGRTVYQILRYIDKNFLLIEKAKDVSHALAYNEHYVSHVFKEKTGTTLKEYITHKKIEHACMLFQSSPWSIEEIAVHLNYSSAHAFRRAFKAVTGKTPSEYKTAFFVL